MSLISPCASPDVSFVRETAVTHHSDCVTTSNSLERDENSCSSVSGACKRSHGHGLTTKSADGASMASCSLYFTPKCYTLKSEKQSAVNSSVNSHTQKRKKISDVPSTKLFQTESDIIDCQTLLRNSIKDPKCVIDLEAEPSSSNKRILESCSDQCLPQESDKVSSDLYVEKKLKIRCSACKCPLGSPENDFTVTCSLTSYSKIHLTSLLNNSLESAVPDRSPSTSVLMADVSLFGKNICDNRNFEGASAPRSGVWCEQDGCVFKSIYCPSCSSPKVCLGVQILATDSLKMNLLNKVCFQHRKNSISTISC